VLEGFQNITRVPELKRRILVTGLLLIVYRIGIHVPTPGIDNLALKAVFDSQAGTLFGLIDMFSGGRSRASPSSLSGSCRTSVPRSSFSC